MARLRWITVMFWNAKNERYKILFRDGQDAWATGEELDNAIAFKSTYSDLLHVQALLEEWDVYAVQAKLTTYGFYCAKHVGPPTSTTPSATASLNGRDVYPQRFAIDKQSASTADTTRPASRRELPGRAEAHVTTRPSIEFAGNPFIFKGNPFAFREPHAKKSESHDENAKWAREEEDFFSPEMHLPSIPSHRVDDPVVMDSNESRTQALAEVPHTDPTTSMAAQAMISLGAATGTALADAISEVPVVSQVEAVSVVVPPEADPKIIAPTNVTMLAVLKEKLAAMKAKVANEAMNKPNGATVVASH